MFISIYGLPSSISRVVLEGLGEQLARTVADLDKGTPTLDLSLTTYFVPDMVSGGRPDIRAILDGWPKMRSSVRGFDLARIMCQRVYSELSLFAVTHAPTCRQVTVVASEWEAQFSGPTRTVPAAID